MIVSLTTSRKQFQRQEESSRNMFKCSMRASTWSCVADSHTGQDEDKKGPGEEASFPDSHHCVIFPRLLQYLQEANELFCDMANPFFLPVYTIDTNRHSQIDLAATHINSQETEGNGLAVPQASHFTSSDMPYSASRVIRPMEEESKVPILFIFSRSDITFIFLGFTAA